MLKNQVLTAVADGLGYNGEGILHIDGTTVFVPFVLPGEKIVFKVLKVKNNVAYGKLLEIVTPSVLRVEPLCKAFGKCGGCQLSHIAYEGQLRFKKELIENCFLKIAGINAEVKDCVCSPNEYYYRNKLQLPLRNINGENKIGFFRENSHDIVPVTTCPIQPDWAKDAISAIWEYIEKSGVSLYSDQTKKGLLRHLIVRGLYNSFLITVVINGDKLPFKKLFISAFEKRFKNFSVYVNENKSDTNVILGEKFKLIYGSGKTQLNEFGISYSIGAESFYQVNTAVKERLYTKIIEIVRESKDNVVIDAFCGAGVLTAMLCEHSETVYGVEISKEACAAAKELSERNGKDNMHILCGDCENILPELIGKLTNENKKITLILDPPRCGADRKTLQKVLECNIDRIIYVSCSPQTLARDSGILIGSLKTDDRGIMNLYKDFSPNYDIKSIIPYDMFPQTKHVETLVVFNRRQEKNRSE